MSDLPNMKFEIREKVKLSNEEMNFKNLASLDLQPIVKVNDNDKEVDIAGYLILSGEFIIRNQYWEEQLEQFDALHYDTFVNNDYKIDSFQHQIPLSIQIDKKRVEDVSNVIVHVDKFDYEILSAQEIELTAQIKLIGVQPERAADDVLMNDELTAHYYDFNEQDYKMNVKEEMNAKDFEVSDIRKAEKENEIIAEDNIANNIKQAEDESVRVDETTKPKLGITAKEDKNDPSHLNPIYSLLRKGQKEFKEVESNPSNENYSAFDNGNKIIEEETVFQGAEQKKEDAPINQSETGEKVAKVKSGSKQNEDNILYGLMQGDEVQRYKIKLYLVQRDDTVEKIAERYGIRSEDIINKNKITTNDLQLGQLLYLPIKK